MKLRLMKAFSTRHENAKIRYHDLPGEGIPVVFIHGLGCASSFDYPQVASHGSLRHHRRILVDLLGSGFSDKPENFGYSIAEHAQYLGDFLDRLGLQSFVLFGHSMGGAIALSLAPHLENGMQGLVLGEANLDSGGGFFSKQIASFGEAEYVASGHQKIIEESRAQGNENWAVCLSMSSPVAVFRESQSLIEGESTGWRSILQSLDIPRTFIFGEQSLPDPDLDLLKEQGIHTEVLEKAGHSMAWDNPGGLAMAIRNAIDRALTPA